MRFESSWVHSVHLFFIGLVIFDLYLHLQVNFVAAIDVYEDGEAGLLLCYNCESDSYLHFSNRFVSGRPSKRPRRSR